MFIGNVWLMKQTESRRRRGRSRREIKQRKKGLKIGSKYSYIASKLKGGSN